MREYLFQVIMTAIALGIMASVAFALTAPGWHP